MKSLLIEAVTNGWIVRPFSPAFGWASGERVQMAVYTKLKDLQDDLPRLLAGSEWTPSVEVVDPPQCKENTRNG